MATKMRSKGTSLLVSIATVYTAVPMMISIDKSGEASETYNGRTLDGTTHSEQPNNGYVSSPKIGGEMFLDKANTVHLFLYTSMRTPPAAGMNAKLTYTDVGPVSEIWNITGIGIDEKFATDDGVKATLSFQTSGDPT